MLWPEILLFAIGVGWLLVALCCPVLAGKWCKQPGRGKSVWQREPYYLAFLLFSASRPSLFLLILMREHLLRRCSLSVHEVLHSGFSKDPTDSFSQQGLLRANSQTCQISFFSHLCSKSLSLCSFSSEKIGQKTWALLQPPSLFIPAPCPSWAA